MCLPALHHVLRGMLRSESLLDLLLWPSNDVFCWHSSLQLTQCFYINMFDTNKLMVVSCLIQWVFCFECPISRACYGCRFVMEIFTGKCNDELESFTLFLSVVV